MQNSLTLKKDEDLLPATLSKEIITDLLRGKLGFNGVVVTDASHMLGMTGAMKRSKLLPTSIAAGCDYSYSLMIQMKISDI